MSLSAYDYKFEYCRGTDYGHAEFPPVPLPADSILSLEVVTEQIRERTCRIPMLIQAYELLGRGWPDGVKCLLQPTQRV